MAKIKIDFAPFLVGTSILTPAALLMLFSAIAYSMVGIPIGDIKPEEMPVRSLLNRNLDQVRENLLTLASIISSENEPAQPYVAFWKARAFAHRIASRRIRFPEFVKAVSSAVPS